MDQSILCPYEEVIPFLVKFDNFGYDASLRPAPMELKVQKRGL